MFTEGADRDLLDINQNYHEKGGDFVVMIDQEKKIVGSHATLPINKKDRVLTFRRLYLKKTHRGEGVGKKTNGLGCGLVKQKQISPSRILVRRSL